MTTETEATHTSTIQSDDNVERDPDNNVVISSEYSLQPCTIDEQHTYDKLLHSVTLYNNTTFWATKFERDNGRNWDLFYKLREQRFFKDRQYILSEFIELATVHNTQHTTTSTYTFGELGCGVGNTLLPLIEQNISHFKYYGCDISQRAVKIIEFSDTYMQRQKQYPNTVNVFAADIASTDFQWPYSNLLNYATMIFVLSSLSMSQIHTALHNAYQCMSNNSYLFIRDYAVYDLAELRFCTAKATSIIKLDEHVYVRRDGTRSQFFELGTICNALQSVGFTVVHKTYVKKTLRNRKLDNDMKRIFIQIRAQKLVQ